MYVCINKTHTQVKMVCTKQCKRCDKSFKAARSNIAYCSYDCRKATHLQSARKARADKCTRASRKARIAFEQLLAVEGKNDPKYEYSSDDDDTDEEKDKEEPKPWLYTLKCRTCYNKTFKHTNNRVKECSEECRRRQRAEQQRIRRLYT